MPAAVTAVELAGRLRVEPVVLRGWLRHLATAGHELLRTHQHQASWTFTDDEARQLAAEYRRDDGMAVGAAGSSGERVPGASSRADRSGPDTAPSLDAAGADGSILGGHQVQMDWLGSTMTTLADLLRPGLKAVTVGINPAPVSVAAGHYYQGSAGQTFYRRLADVGLLPPGGGFEDDRAFAAGIGFTDVVKRPTGNANQGSPQELVVGRRILEDKLRTLEVPLVIFTFKKAATSVSGTSRDTVSCRPRVLLADGCSSCPVPTSAGSRQPARCGGTSCCRAPDRQSDVCHVHLQPGRVQRGMDAQEARVGSAVGVAAERSRR